MIRETNYDEIFDTQEDFRVVLHCMSNPGSIQQLDGAIDSFPGVSKTSVLIGFSLLDSNTTFYQNYDEDLDKYFILNTSSAARSANEADFLFLNGSKSKKEEIEDAKEGMSEYPEGGAFLIIEVKKISDRSFSKSLEVVLKGPGVKDTCSIHIGGLKKELLQAIQEKNIEYPLGVDTILTDESGKLVCIPRSNQFTF